MLVNPLPKSLQTLIRKLHQKKYRQEFRKYLAEGYRLCSQLVESEPHRVEFVVISENVDLNKDVLQKAQVYVLPNTLFETLTDTEHSQGILAVVKMPEVTNLDTLVDSAQLLVACDAIQDPGNLGTMIRNAVWFGADGILLGEGSVDVFNPKTVRSSMSALSQLPIFNGSLEEVFTKAEAKGYTIFLFQLDECSEALPKVRFPEKSVLVFGNEGNGIRPELKTQTRISVKIPDYSLGKAESLNVSTAASVALYAYCNQHKKF